MDINNKIELKNVVTISVEKNGVTYIFSIPAGSSYGNAYDAAHDCMGKLLEMMREAAEKAAPKKDDVEK